MKKILSNIKLWVLWGIICFIGLTSCRSVQYIPVEKIKTEYISKLDTTIIHDSVYIKEWTKNDTVYLFKDRWHDKVSIKHDTICRIDSIPVIQEVQVVTNKLNARQATQITLFWVLLVGILLYILLKIYLKFRYG